MCDPEDILSRVRPASVKRPPLVVEQIVNRCRPVAPTHTQQQRILSEARQALAKVRQPVAQRAAPSWWLEWSLAAMFLCACGLAWLVAEHHVQGQEKNNHVVERETSAIDELVAELYPRIQRVSVSSQWNHYEDVLTATYLKRERTFP